MTKTNDLAQSFIKKSQNQAPLATRAPINAFSSIFSVQESTEGDYASLENILREGDGESGLSFQEDLSSLSRITQEVKAIKKQEMLLIGERIALAREIFKKYKEKGFRKWLEFAFGSFKTGYNYLSFYDLYSEIPESLRELLKEMPAKASYILASKKGSIEQKAKIVEEFSRQPAHYIIASIHEAFGVDSEVRGSYATIDSILYDLEKKTERLMSLSSQMTIRHRKKIGFLIKKFQKLGNP